MKTLSTKRQWTDCLADNDGKRPRLSPGKAKGLSCTQARKLAKQSTYNYGFLFSDTDKYIGIDVDVDSTGKKKNTSTEIPDALIHFIQDYPTHVHYSPSGQGLHLIYKLDDATCAWMNENKFKQGSATPQNGALYNGDWRWASSFLTFTSNLWPTSTAISTLDLEAVRWLTGLKATIAPVIDINTKLARQTQVPNISALKDVLQLIPPLYDYWAKQICDKLDFAKPTTDYDYWLLVGQACAHTACCYESFGEDKIKFAICEAYVTWSAQSPSFISVSDVEAKFETLVKSTRQKVADGEQVASFKVLTALAKAAFVKFPILKGKDLHADMASLKNFDFLMANDGLTMWLDTMGGGITLHGPPEIIRAWFRPIREYDKPCLTGQSQIFDYNAISIVMLAYFQYRFGQSMSLGYAKTGCAHLMQQMKRTNVFKDWIAAKPWDGTPRLEQVCNSITIAPGQGREAQQELYASYIRKALFAMIGIHFWPEDRPKIPAMLILKGPQNTFKSSWAEWLIPQELVDYLGMGTMDIMLAANVERDRLLCTKALIVVNECEPMFTPKNEQRVKSSVDQEIVTYRDLYSPTPTSRQRTALIIGTTNKAQLFTGSLGTRKIWQIPVKICDSYLVKNMDKQQLFAEIKTVLTQYKESTNQLVQTAWGHSATELEVIEMDNKTQKGTHGLGELLLETFGDPLKQKFNPKEYRGKRGLLMRRGNVYSLDNRPNAWTVTDMLRFLRDRYPDDPVTRAAVKYAMIEYSGTYTKSSHKTIDPFRNYSIADRQITQGKVALSPSIHVYLFPALVYQDTKTASTVEVE